MPPKGRGQAHKFAPTDGETILHQRQREQQERLREWNRAKARRIIKEHAEAGGWNAELGDIMGMLGLEHCS